MVLIVFKLNVELMVGQSFQKCFTCKANLRNENYKATFPSASIFGTGVNNSILYFACGTCDVTVLHDSLKDPKVLTIENIHSVIASTYANFVH